MANKTINQITNVSTNAQDNDLLMMWDNAREKTVKIKNKDFNKHNQPKTLETPIEVDNVEETTVEGALGAINDKVKNFTAGVAFKGTRSAYETAKLIPEGSEGHIPSGSLVIITDEGQTFITSGTGNGQTLEPVASTIFTGTKAEWNNLSSAEKARYLIVNFTDDSDAQNKDYYSTSEVKTNKVWIDGKPIYRKVVDCGALPNATTKNVAHNIANLDNLVSLKGYAISDYIRIPLPYVRPGGNDSVGLLLVSTNIRLETISNMSSYSACVILEYTKTTD